MKKNKQELIERYIYLEKWLKNNYPSNMTDNELIDYFSSYFTNKHDVIYLIEAYCLPKEEFEREMTREAKKGFYMNINALYDYFSKKYSISKDKHIAEDITSETFLKAIKSIKIYKFLK